MKTNTAIRFLLLSLLLALVGILTNFIAFPRQTSAAELSVQTAQLLPLGGSTCAPLVVSGFTPYTYDGALHSFEFSLQDSSYVAVFGSAGNTSVPFNLMTRRAGPSGSVRIHADIVATLVAGNLPVRITLLSAKGPGQPVCIAVVTTSVLSSGSVATILPPIVSPVATPRPVIAPAKPAQTTGGELTKSTTPTATTDVAVTSSVVANAKDALKNMCAAGGGSARLWFFLLAVYALVVCAALFWRPPQVPLAYNKEWVAGAILIPFVLLFGFWYLVETCRASPWAPTIAVLIALAGLATAFWNDRKDLQVIILPAAKK